MCVTAGGGDLWWTWAASATCFALALLISAGASPIVREQFGLAALPEAQDIAGAPQAPENVADIVTSRCSMCHAQEPSWAGLSVAPKGVVLDTPEAIERNRRRIGLFAGLTNAMPPNNITEMTATERDLIVKWASTP